MSEPNYQSPDDRNSTITYEEQPIPLDENLEPGVLDAEYLNTHLAKRLFNKYGSSLIVANRLERYGNSILLGSFCYAITFIIYGFYRCKVYKKNESFMWAMILFFGSIGQATAGFLELIKGRHFPALLYIVTGFYCLSHYMFYVFPKFTDFWGYEEMTYVFYSGSVCAFYSAMVVIFFAVTLASVKTNILFILQCLTGFAFFLLRAIGEGCGSLHTKRNAAGILQAISGFFSLFIFISQIVNNEVFESPVFPSMPMDNNGIDVSPSKR